MHENADIAITVDTVLMSLSKDFKHLNVLMVQRNREPFNGFWALPGTFVHQNESLEDAVYSNIRNKTGIEEGIAIEQLYTFGKVNRDPRMRTISVGYMGFISSNINLVPKSNNVSDAQWMQVSVEPKTGTIIFKNPNDGSVLDEKIIAFDHYEIISSAIQRVKNKVEYTDIAFNLLPEEFTLTEIQYVYETLLFCKMDKSNFHKYIKKFVEETGNIEQNVAHRPGKKYKLNTVYKNVPWR